MSNKYVNIGLDLYSIQGRPFSDKNESRYIDRISSGFSIGARYGLGKASPQDNVNLDYSYLDGFIRFNITENRRL